TPLDGRYDVCSPDLKKAAPPQGPVPDPHADKPAPLPDAHSRPAPDADVIRPDQAEELGPAVELFRAAGAEAAAEVLRTDEARARSEERRVGSCLLQG